MDCLDRCAASELVTGVCGVDKFWAGPEASRWLGMDRAVVLGQVLSNNRFAYERRWGCASSSLAKPHQCKHGKHPRLRPHT